MRGKGLHIWDGFPCFFTTAHSDDDIAFIKKTFKESVAEMQAVKLLPGATSVGGAGTSDMPPVPGARLGRDPEGFPAWYVADPKQPGKYVKVEDTIKGFKEIIAGIHDDLPEAAFYMVGPIEDVVEKARKLEQVAA